jgi:hypothetical protein
MFQDISTLSIQNFMDGIFLYEKNIHATTIQIFFNDDLTMKSLSISKHKIMHRIPFPTHLKSWIAEYERMNEFYS